jgi:hypothetical protein
MRAVFLMLAMASTLMGFVGIRKYLDYTEIVKYSRLFATGAVQDIVSSWNVEEFKNDIGTAYGSGKDIDASFAGYRRLGRLRSRIDCNVYDVDTRRHEGSMAVYYTAHYVCSAQFDKGPATIDLRVYSEHHASFWRVQYFHVDSPLFAQASAR